MMKKLLLPIVVLFFPILTFSQIYNACNDTGTGLTVGTSCNPIAMNSANNNDYWDSATGCGATDQDDVWAFFDATSTSTTITYAPQTGVGMDAILHLFESSCSATMPSVACSNSGGDGIAETIVYATTIGQRYLIRVQKLNSDGNMNGTICVYNAPPAPSNDDPCNAEPLAVGSSCSFSTYTNENATASSGVPAPGCASYSGGDVWFRVTVPASGNIELDSNTGVITDGGMAVYSGTCGSLTLVDCDDDSSANGLMSYISLTGQTPGATLYVRFWEFGNNNNGTFNICAYEPTPPTPTYLGCGDSFTDNGGSTGNYSSNSNETYIISPDVPGEPMTVTFTSFYLESGYDYLSVYDGPTTASPSLGTYTGTAIPGPFISSDPTGSLTFVFTSDGSVQYAGWVAEILCCEVNITDTLSPVAADACTLDYAMLEATSNTPLIPSGLVYSESFDSGTIPADWSIVNGGTGTNWIISGTNNAGGTANEAMLEWNTGFENATWRMESGSIPIAGETGLQLSFDQSLNHWDSSYVYQINLQIQVDGGAWTTYYSVNPVTADIGPATVAIDLSAISGNNLAFRFNFIGESFGFFDWSIDNILLTGDDPAPPTPSIIWSPITGLYTDAALTTPYTGGYAGTVYAAPNGTVTYTATDDTNGCTATVDVSRLRKIWNGSVSSDWYTPANWTPAVVPTDSDCVTIPDSGSVPNVPSVVGTPPIPPPPGLAGNLTLEANAYLELEQGASIMITDWIDIDTNATMLLRDDANLIQINDVANSGNIYQQRNVPGVTSTDYVYWCSPVVGFNVSNVSPGTSSSLIYEWIPTVAGNGTGNYGNWQNVSGVMQPGQGYIIRGISGTAPMTTAAANTIEFLGTPRNGQVSVPVSKGTYTGIDYPGAGSTMATQMDDNWNLIGNPYPSAISGTDFISYNSIGGTNGAISGTIYLWRHLSAPSTNADPFYSDLEYNYNENDYISYNGVGSTPVGFNGSIASGQAFFVLMDDSATSTNVIFNNNMRFDSGLAPYDNSQFYRTNDIDETQISSTEKHRIWLDLIDQDNQAVPILIGYVTNATLDVDPLYDGHNISTESFRFYSLIDNDKFTIQGRPTPFQIEDEVPLGFENNHAGSYTIAINSLDGLFTGTDQHIYLEDTYEDIIHDLKASAYNFNSESGMFNDRFVLRYTNSTLNVDNFDLDHAISVQAPNSEYILILSNLNKIESVQLFDLQGRTLIQKSHLSDNRVIIDNLNCSDGTYIVKLILDNGQESSKKVVLKN